MPIQHRNIPDSELHEVKGAATAPAGFALVADGNGRATFQRIGSATLAGSLPTSGVHQIFTDGLGGFTTGGVAYGTFIRNQSEGFDPTDTIVPISQTAGISISTDSRNFYVTHGGVYLFLGSLVEDPTIGPMPPDTVWNRINNRNTLVGVAIDRDVCVLEPGVPYYPYGVGRFTLVKVA